MKIPRLKFYQQTILAMLIGGALGFAFGPKVAPLAQFSKIIIQLVQAFATPLLFFAILESVLSGQFRGRGVTTMIFISAVNACFAVAIALGISNIFQPGSHMTSISGGGALLDKKWDWQKGLAGYIPESVLGPFVSNAVPALILLAVVIGLAVRAVEKDSTPEEAVLLNRMKVWSQVLVKLNLKIIEWIVKLVPIAVMASVAKATGEHGFSMIQGLAAYVIATIGGMAIHILLVYQTWIKVIAKKSLRTFWREAKEPAVYSFGTNSSLATLPVTLSALSRLKISPASSRLAACVGTNLNNDGILLYEVVAALFVAQANGIHLSLVQQLGVAAISVVATIGIAGIPEAGIISLFLVLNTLGLPAESLPVLLTVDWLVARCRSITNVVSDMTVAIGIEHLSPPAETLSMLERPADPQRHSG